MPELQGVQLQSRPVIHFRLQSLSSCFLRLCERPGAVSMEQSAEVNQQAVVLLVDGMAQLQSKL